MTVCINISFRWSLCESLVCEDFQADAKPNKSTQLNGLTQKYDSTSQFSRFVNLCFLCGLAPSSEVLTTQRLLKTEAILEQNYASQIKFSCQRFKNGV